MDEVKQLLTLQLLMEQTERLSRIAHLEACLAKPPDSFRPLYVKENWERELAELQTTYQRTQEQLGALVKELWQEAAAKLPSSMIPHPRRGMSNI